MNQNFKKQQKNGLFSQMERTGRFPIDPDTVVTSYTDLQNILKENDKVYPGMIIALSDDVSEPNGIKVPDADREHMGLYWVTNDTSGSENFVSYKLATVVDADSRSMLSYEKLWNDINEYTTSSLNPLINTTVPGLEDEVNSLSYDITNYIDGVYKYLDVSIEPAIYDAISYEKTTRNMLMAFLPEEQYFPPTTNDFNLCYNLYGNLQRFSYIIKSDGEKYYYDNVEYHAKYSKYIKLIWENTAPRFNIYDVFDEIFIEQTAMPRMFLNSYLGYTNIIYNRDNITDGIVVKPNTAYWNYNYTYINENTSEITKNLNDIIHTSNVNNIIYSYYNEWADDWTHYLDGSESNITRYATWHDEGKSYYYEFLIQHDNQDFDYFPISNNIHVLNTAGKIQLIYMDLPIYYCGAQKKLYSNLIKGNVFIPSTSGAWNTNDYNVIHFNDKINIKLSLNIYIGFKLKYGVFGLDTNVSDTSIIQSIIEYLIGSTETKPSVTISDSKISTDNLVTGMLTDILKTSNSMVYFGKNKIGIDSFNSGTKKYFFIGFPTNYFEYTKLNSDDNIQQVFEAKFSGTGSWGTFGTDDTDPCNYIINNITINDINYTFIVAKTNLDFKFGGESSDGYGVRLTCRQKGLVDDIPINN